MGEKATLIEEKQFGKWKIKMNHRMDMHTFYRPNDAGYANECCHGY
jgi:hypothetical protein